MINVHAEIERISTYKLHKLFSSAYSDEMELNNLLW